MSQQIQDRELSWDDEIENDGKNMQLLPSGEYSFRVINHNKKRYQPKPGAKMAACPMVEVILEVEGKEIKENLYLLASQEWKLAAFFRAIGQKKHGEKLRMDWNRVNGSTGRCKIKIEEYEKRDGSGKAQSNKLDSWLDPVENQADEPEAF